MRLASLCYGALNATGVTTLARRLTRRGVVLCYHNVVGPHETNATDRLGLHMPFASFERQMRWLADTYDVVPLEEFVGRLLRGASLRGTAAITFDDGYAGVFDHAWPLLRDLGMSATVFVVADAPSRDDGFWWDDPEVLRAHSPERHEHWLTSLGGDRTAIVRSVAHTHPRWHPPSWCRPAGWQTVADAAARGLRIGVHSATHRSLLELNEPDLHDEIVESREVVRRRTGVVPVFFAYPYGLWNDRARRAVQAAGYRAAFALDAAHAVSGDPWSLPRVNVPSGIEDAAFHAWMSGLNPRRGRSS